jgi:hypothetical protein
MPLYFWSVYILIFVNAVLKANATFPDKSPASSAPLFEQQVNEAPPAV